MSTTVSTTFDAVLLSYISDVVIESINSYVHLYVYVYVYVYLHEHEKNSLRRACETRH